MMRQYCYNIFRKDDHVIRLKMYRDHLLVIDSCKFDYINRRDPSDIIAESFEAIQLIKFLPDNMRYEAEEMIRKFDFEPCFDMSIACDSLDFVDDYI